MSPDWGAELARVAEELLGQPTRKMRGGTEWRYGSHGSLAVRVDGEHGGTWTDFESGEGGGVLALVQRELGVDREGASAWLRDRRGFAPIAPTRARPAPPKPDKPSATQALARQWWAQAVAIPADVGHPARRWLAGTGGHGPLWRGELEGPSALRWLPSAKRDGGMLVACIAPWAAWWLAWPDVPTPSGVQLVYVAGDGTPARDYAGLSKRTYGPQAGGGVVIGEARTGGRVLVAEGVADGLALASRFDSPVWVTCGTSGLLAEETAQALADASDVEIWADSDPSGGGRAAAGVLAARLECAGVPVSLRRVTGAKDAAGAVFPFPPIDSDVLEAETRRGQQDGLPRWEAARQAAALLTESASTAKETA